MIRIMILLSLIFLMISCGDISQNKNIKVIDAVELKKAIETAKPGNEIILANGIWKDVKIHFIGKGEKGNPIILRAETPGKVFIEGESYIKFGGEYLTVSGLYFRNGYTPSKTIIEFRIDKNNIANNCRVTNTVIEEFTQPDRYIKDHWIEFWGRHNQLDHCYIAGKSNQGPTLRVNLSGNEHIRNYHQIVNNHFGPRPRKGGPKSETIQIGDSYTSMTPSHVNVSNNLFEKCNGEVEIISSKSNFNEFRNNVFYESEGSLVMRHGNYCIIDGNFFIGTDESQFIGGIRVINTGHWITNNYFYKLKGEEFRSPLAIMNGIPRSPLNRYNQVTDVVVAHNTWVDCTSPWQFSVGANMNKSSVLPKKEIRSARPKRILIANNIIYNQQADELPIKAYDKVDGITMRNNVIDNNDGKFNKYDGLETKSISMDKITEQLFVPSDNQSEILGNIYPGFEFETIEKDIFGTSRSYDNFLGAISQSTISNKLIINKKLYGTDWYSNEKPKIEPTIIAVKSNTGLLAEKVAEANDGDILELSGGVYNLTESIVINKSITIKSMDANNNVEIRYSGAEDTPAFEMNPKGNLTLDNIILKGGKTEYAFSSLVKNMSKGYNLWVNNSEISNFKYILKSYRGSFADTISFTNSVIKNSLNGIELAAETDDKGDYNAEFVTFDNCEFKSVKKNVINFYRGGYDESTIGGNLLVTNSRFTNCGAKEKNKILLNTRGIINVDISNNTFSNNPVKLVALLWGEKNNYQSDNKITRSGKIRTEQYLKQKLMY